MNTKYVLVEHEYDSWSYGAVNSNVIGVYSSKDNALNKISEINNCAVSDFIFENEEIKLENYKLKDEVGYSLWYEIKQLVEDE